jgi:hypothetical protein
MEREHHLGGFDWEVTYMTWAQYKGALLTGKSPHFTTLLDTELVVSGLSWDCDYL